MLIAQISDLHYRPQGTRLFGYVDVHGATVRAVDWLNGQFPAIDAVLITGDLVNDGDAADYQALAEVLSGLTMPFAVIAGNHDRRALLAEAFPAPGERGPASHYCWASDFGPVRIIGLDTLVEGEHYGALGDEQLEWLDAVLAPGHEKPTLVALHHPPFETAITFMDGHPLQKVGALESIIARHPNVEAVLAGHIHRVIHRRFGGTIAMVGPGTAHQVTLDLSEQKNPRWIMEPAGCLLHHWSPQNGLVSHAAWFGDFGPEAPFHNHHGTVPTL